MPQLTIVENDSYCADSQAGDPTVTFAMPDRGLLTVREVADAMRVSTMTVYRLIKAGELRAIRVGKHFRIKNGDLVAYLDSRMVGVGEGDDRTVGAGDDDGDMVGREADGDMDVDEPIELGEGGTRAAAHAPRTTGASERGGSSWPGG
jgi:excisionase family DNA binding protein